MKRPDQPISTRDRSANSANTDTQQQQADTVASLRAAQVASLRGTLRTVSAAEESALEAQGALARQGEALDRIDGKLDQADRSLTVSKVYMRTIGSWTGWIANAITGAEEKAAEKAAAANQSDRAREASTAAPAAKKSSSFLGGLFKGKKEKTAGAPEGAEAQAAKSSGGITTKSTPPASADAESDALLDALEHNVLRLQAHAVRQGDTVREQNARLEALDEKMGAVQDKTRKLTRDIHKAL